MRIKLTIAVLLSALMFCGNASYAAEKDLSLIAEGQYFSIYGPKDLDIVQLLARLNYQYFLQADGLLGQEANDPPTLLSKTTDALYLEASDILGAHVYSFHGKINIYPDRFSMNDILGKTLHRDLQESSYYLHETGTIYISYPDLTLGMLGHETAHAIISSYFVVLPPPNIQEILAGYVEYSLRKQTQTLP